LVIAELDARGEIDSHTAMCLQFTIEDLLTRGASEIVIDLRDLTAIDQQALALLHQARRTAAAAGVPLSLLIGARPTGDAVARAVQHSGLPIAALVSPGDD
jgi:anti-anti-sigma factor